jgi:hypothetical protein
MRTFWKSDKFLQDERYSFGSWSKLMRKVAMAMWFYIQASGQLFWQHPPVIPELIGTGYSGAGTAKNDPDSQCVQDLGPIPRGDYTIGAIGDYGPTGTELKRALPLTPDQANDMCTPARTNFLIHGDSLAHPGWASAGCIIIDKTVRERIGVSGDTMLRVLRTGAP